MTIGELAKLTDVPIETIRFYERKGLLQQPAKPQQGFRQYHKEHITHLTFIRNAKNIGFTLAEIEELLHNHFYRNNQCCDVRDFTLQKIEDIDTKIALLTNFKEELKRLVHICQESSDEECPILENLKKEIV